MLGEQLSVALDCLRDHVDGACPQIPYYTISLLAAAVSYFADELDVIPDFLPRVGHLDDAVVMAMAYELGRDGLRRYCAWKGRDAHTLLRGAACFVLRHRFTRSRQSTVESRERWLSDDKPWHVVTASVWRSGRSLRRREGRSRL